MGSNRRHIHLAASAVLVAGLITACASGSDDSATSEPAYDSSEGYSEEPAAEEPAEAPTADVDTSYAGESGIDLGQIGRDVIIEMYVTLTSDDIGRSVASISAKASALGGGVASSDVSYGDPQQPDTGYAILVVKVPPAAIDDLMAGLERAGTVRSITQSAQDVTEQLVDLDVRIANARESVENVRDFMERAEDLSDLVTLEGELTRRQTELERLEAQERNLSERVALSTVTVEIVPTAAIPEPVVDDDSIADAFRSGWDGFVTMIWGIGYVFAVLAPFLGVALVVSLIVVGIVRRRRHRDPFFSGPDATARSGAPSDDETA
jgi:hypothetical protein